MKRTLTSTIDGIISFLFVIVIASFPLIIADITTEIFETPKLIILGSTTSILLLLTAISWVLKGKIDLIYTALDVPLIALLGVVLASAWFSVSQNTSVFGNFPVVHGSAISWVMYILFYFLLVNHLKTRRQMFVTLYTLMGAAVVVSLLSILSFFGLALPFSFAQAANFTLTGSSFSTIALCMILLPFAVLLTIAPVDYTKKIAGIFLTGLFSITILLLGTPLLYGAAILLIAATFLVAKDRQLSGESFYIVLPAIIVSFVAVFALFSLNDNLIYGKMRSFPREIQQPFSTSWKVIISSFRDRPILGTGPSTYSFNFTQYKPAEFNLSRFWNLRFGTAFNEFFQLLATLGLAGFGVFVFSLVRVGLLAWERLNVPNEAPTGDKIYSAGVTLSVLAAVLLLFVHTTTLVSLVATLIVLALFIREKMLSHHSPANYVHMDTAVSSRTSGVFPGVALAVITGFVIWSGWHATAVIAADYYHSLGVKQSTVKGKATETYQNLARAEKFNPRVDLYRIDLVTINFALANSIASEKGPTQDIPDRKLDDQDKNTILTLLSQAVAESRAAVTLSPFSVGNWETMGALYRQITGAVPDAMQYSFDAYNRAIALDPYNPNLRIIVGSMYYSLKNYDAAIRYFSDAVNLKPDFANGYYNLSIVLRDKGDLQNAVLAAEQTVKVLETQKESEDYNIASASLDQLKKELANKSNEEKSDEGEVAGTSTGLTSPNQKEQPLQNKKLPKATPSASPKPTS